MNNVTNLNRFRKKKKRAENEASAEENRAKFGQTKVEKTKTKQIRENLNRHLDDHKQSDDSA